jgi:chromosomal replication initiation ATPase DnaA
MSVSSAQELFQTYKAVRRRMAGEYQPNYVDRNIVRPVDQSLVLTKWQMRKLRNTLDDALKNAENDEFKIYQPKLRTIIKAVSEEFEISITDLLSARKPTYLIIPRFMIAYLARSLTTKSTTEIGRAMNNRDHTTIIHAINRAHEILASDNELCKRVAVLEDILKDPRNVEI